MTLYVQLLGGLHVSDEAGPLSLPTSLLQQKMFVYLLLHRQEELPRSQIASAFWPEHDSARARRNLRTNLFRLKKSFPFLEDELSLGQQTIEWNNFSNIQVDVEQWNSGLDDLKDDSLSSMKHLESLEGLLDLYKGSLLPWCYDDWLLTERERLAQQYYNVLAETLQYGAEHKPQLALSAGKQLMREDPYTEEWIEHSIKLLVHLGQYKEAQELLYQSQDMFFDELGVEFSSPYLHRMEGELHAYLMDSSTKESLETTLPAVESVTVNARVEHEERFSVQSSGELSSFVGRYRVLEEVVKQLRQPQCRLLSLVGLGGVGKTRVALEAVKQLKPHAAKIYSVDLDGRDSNTRLELVLAQALQVHIGDEKQAIPQLATVLDCSQTYLFLDNFEPWIKQSDVLEQLLARTTHLTCLVTSRVALAVDGEWQVVLEGLKLPEGPELEQCRQSEAIELFSLRASQVSHSFALEAENVGDVYQICHWLDGLPLGIELACVWLRSLSPQQLWSELQKDHHLLVDTSERFSSRHRTLWQVFNGAIQTLDPQDYSIAMKLSVFAGGFLREGAQKVAGATLFSLQNLVHLHLLKRTESGRYQFHPLVREFLLEHLVSHQAMEHQTRVHMADYYTDMLLPCRDLLEGSQQHEVRLKLLAELPNVSEVTLWAAQVRYASYFVVLHSLYSFFRSARIYHEALALIRRCEQAWLSNQEGSDSTVYLQIRRIHGTLLSPLLQYVDAQSILQECVEGFRQLKQWDDLHASLIALGHALSHQGHFDQALEVLEEGESLHELSHPSLLLDNLSMQTYCCLHSNRRQKAIELVQRQLQHCPEGNLERRANLYNSMGATSLYLDRFHEALDAFEEARVILEEQGNDWFLSSNRLNAGKAYFLLEEYHEAIRVLQYALSISISCGRTHARIFGCLFLGQAYNALERFPQSKNYLLQGISLCIEQKMNLVIHDMVTALCATCLGLEEVETAQRLFPHVVSENILDEDIVLIYQKLQKSQEFAGLQLTSSSPDLLSSLPSLLSEQTLSELALT